MKQITIDKDAIAKKIFRKIEAGAKKHSKYVGFTELAESKDVYLITIESDINTAVIDLAYDAITTNDRAKLVQIVPYEGKFDWASDTYIKPCVVASFRF